MKVEVYQEIVSYLQTVPYPKFADFRTQFPNVDTLSLRSIYSTERVRKTRKCFNLHSNPDAASIYFQWFTEKCDSVADEVGFVLKFAQTELDLSPALFARILVEKYVEKEEFSRTAQQDTSDKTASHKSSSVIFKEKVSEFMRDPRCIPHKILSREVWLCVLQDEVYGPITESMKHLFGEEKELFLKEKLRERKIPFLDENELRSQGYDKTPDVKLEIPCVLNGEFVINWIESKALFGDQKSHETYMKDQYLTYVNRFGNGIVIYWLGFVDSVAEKNGKDGIFVYEDLPECLVSMKELYTKSE